MTGKVVQMIRPCRMDRGGPERGQYVPVMLDGEVDGVEFTRVLDRAGYTFRYDEAADAIIVSNLSGRSKQEI